MIKVGDILEHKIIKGFLALVISNVDISYLKYRRLQVLLSPFEGDIGKQYNETEAVLNNSYTVVGNKNKDEEEIL